MDLDGGTAEERDGSAASVLLTRGGMVGIEIELSKVELRIDVVMLHRLLQTLLRQSHSLLVGKLSVIDTKVVLRLRMVLRRRLL